ncbi:MAG: hypothetical protein K6F10_06330 [Paludibacteraceae bacterium]|nr:hypothetical protein [Paludibacteraceae bacterium]
MKHILYIYDYIFYRIHKFVLAHPKMIVSDGAPYIFSFITILMPIVGILAPIFRMYNIHIQRYSVGWMIFMVILVAVQSPIWKRYQNPINIKEFEERWDCENPQQRTRRGFLVTLFIFNNVIVIPFLLYILAHYNII